jgi:hypothetical protein
VTASRRPSRLAQVLVGGLVASLVVIAVASRFASSQPDGLEKVAADEGIAATEQAHDLAEGPFADYRAPGLGAGAVGAGVAGALGLAVTFAVCTAAVVVARRRRAGPHPAAP